VRGGKPAFPGHHGEASGGLAKAVAMAEFCGHYVAALQKNEISVEMRHP
jgi:hypothetical protein